MTSSSYVKHDGQRWHIRRGIKIDGEPGYILQQMRPGKPPRVISARARECEPWQRPAERLRVFRDGDKVLEIRTAGDLVRSIKVRTARSSKRFDTSIKVIYFQTLKAVGLAKAKRSRRPSLNWAR